MSFKTYEACEFSETKISNLKNGKKIFAVFSTFGERESDLIFDKISLLKKKLGHVIDRIILSHRRTGNDEEATERNALKADPDADIFICNFYSVSDMEDEKGKGSDMRRALYYINKKYSDKSDPENIIILFLDSDVSPDHFGEHFISGLAGAVLEGNDFAKAGFWREMGRVKKFVAQPLFSVIDHEKLNKLSDFAYPLSGEVAGTLNFFNRVSFWQMYGVETGINIDACFGNYKIADVNLGLYDHEHHEDRNIQKISFGVIRTYFLKLIEYGIIELKDNASVSDLFKGSEISRDGSRKEFEFDLKEKKYQPLINIL